MFKHFKIYLKFKQFDLNCYFFFSFECVSILHVFINNTFKVYKDDLELLL